MSLVLAGLFVLFLLMGIPVAIVIGAATMSALNLSGVPLMVVPQQMFSGINSFALVAVPMFVLAGDVMAQGEISKRLVAFADSMFGFIKGGLSIVSVLAGMFFAAISGSGAATTAAVGASLVPELKRKTGASPEDIQDAIEEISTLEPAPGKRFSPDSNSVIQPDVTVYQDEYDEWQVVLNSDYIPRLRISSTYKEMLAKGTLSKQEKDFMLERMRSDKFLINSIEQRQQTIERITREILKFQNEFFEVGVSKLRPLTMNTIAETVGVHETTVSRAIANKYIRTPHGVFAFKYFFSELE